MAMFDISLIYQQQVTRKQDRCLLQLRMSTSPRRNNYYKGFMSIKVHPWYYIIHIKHSGSIIQPNQGVVNIHGSREEIRNSNIEMFQQHWHWCTKDLSHPKKSNNKFAPCSKCSKFLLLHVLSVCFEFFGSLRDAAIPLLPYMTNPLVHSVAQRQRYVIKYVLNVHSEYFLIICHQQHQYKTV